MKSAALLRLCIAGAVAGAAAFASGQASAVTRTGSLPVQATVTSACNVSTATLDFGSYVTGQTGNKDVAGSIGYASCTGVTFTLELGVGANASGTTRNMKNAGTSLLRYELYQDTVRSKIFGTGTSGLSVTAATSGSGTVPVQGRIFAGQSVPMGSYSDTVAITLSF
jgi:spore coat protein U-like protein